MHPNMIKTVATPIYANGDLLDDANLPLNKIAKAAHSEIQAIINPTLVLLYPVRSLISKGAVKP